MMYNKIYLRNEANAKEHRTPLVPRDVSKMVNNGFTIYVERSVTRTYNDDEYKSAGAILVQPDDYSKAMSNFQDVAVLGLKAPLQYLHNQTHIFFSHCFKEQEGSQELLQKLHENRIQLYDLEYFTDDFDKRLFAFGYHAGFVGGGLGLMQYFTKKEKNCNGVKKLSPFKNEEEFFEKITQTFSSVDYKTTNIAIIGAKGRCGHGVQQILRHFDMKYDVLNRNDDKQNLGKYDIIYNCILLETNLDETWVIPLDDGKCRVLVDVSCDCNKAYHPFNNIYNETTNPVLTKGSLDIIAIDNLPSLLPRESSDAFSSVFSNFLCENVITENNPWTNAYNAYLNVMQNRKV